MSTFSTVGARVKFVAVPRDRCDDGRWRPTPTIAERLPDAPVRNG